MARLAVGVAARHEDHLRQDHVVRNCNLGGGDAVTVLAPGS
jgi:hypothetical protein